jgi:IgGFc binding protein
MLLGGAAAVLVAAACSTRDPFETPAKETPFTTPDAEAPAPPPAEVKCGLHCSRDLKQVLDGCAGSETVVQTCNADQGCGGATCVDACSAAALNKGSVGCEFWAIPPDAVSTGKGSCFTAQLANTWDRPVNISAEYGTGALDISHSTYTIERIGDDPVYTLLEGPLPVGQVAVIFLAHSAIKLESTSALCPVGITPAMTVDPIRHGTSVNKAFHLKADAPIAAYSMYPYGGADSYYPTATLLLPVSSWEKNYYAVSPFDFGNTRRRRVLQIVANEDDTQVRIRPTVEIAAGQDVAGATAGVTQTWTLSKGQALQFTQTSATGSPIESTKPVGIFGGAECTELPTPYCDLLQQQIPPPAQWGTEYPVVPFKGRQKTLTSNFQEIVPYTIIAASDGTQLTYEPKRPLNAPETLNAGQSVSFLTDDIFVVKTQDSKHPIHVNVYMTGSTNCNGNPKYTQLGGYTTCTTGDPDFVNVPAADQFLDRYVFFTDFTYPSTILTMVRRKTATGFVPVKLSCGGEVTGWQPLGTSGQYEFAWVQLTDGFVSKGDCGYGRQEASSDGPFGITVWGMGQDASYGYVGGTGLRPINDAPPTPVPVN